jgi:hypothetical protein
MADFSMVSMIDSSVVVSITINLSGFARTRGPLSEWTVWIGVNHGYGTTVACQFCRQQHSCCRFADAAFRICEHNSWHTESSPLLHMAGTLAEGYSILK